MMMARLPQGKNPDGVAGKVVELLWPFSKAILTITTDNGSEFLRHTTIAKRLNTTVYFADTYASWQKGTIENTDNSVRQYI